MAERWLPPKSAGGRPTAPAAPAPEDPRSAPDRPAVDARSPTFVQPSAEQHNGQAIAALVLGIFGLVVLVLSIGLLFIFALPCSVAAWIVGVRARRRADRGEAGQRGLAQAGMILGLVGTALGAIALVGWTLLFALGSDVLEDLEDELDQQRDRDDGPDGDGTFVRALVTVAALAARTFL